MNAERLERMMKLVALEEGTNCNTAPAWARTIVAVKRLKEERRLALAAARKKAKPQAVRRKKAVAA